jgi:hypothetical protein
MHIEPASLGWSIREEKSMVRSRAVPRILVHACASGGFLIRSRPATARVFPPQGAFYVGVSGFPGWVGGPWSIHYTVLHPSTGRLKSLRPHSLSNGLRCRWRHISSCAAQPTLLEQCIMWPQTRLDAEFGQDIPVHWHLMRI